MFNLPRASEESDIVCLTSPRYKSDARHLSVVCNSFINGISSSGICTEKKASAGIGARRSYQPHKCMCVVTAIRGTLYTTIVLQQSNSPKLESKTYGTLPFGQSERMFLTTAFCGPKGSLGFDVASIVSCCSGVRIMSPPKR